MGNKTAARLCMTAGFLILLSGGIFAFMRLWLYAALLSVGGIGCLVGALHFNSRKDD